MPTPTLVRKGKVMSWLKRKQKAPAPKITHEEWMVVHVWGWDSIAEKWTFLHSMPCETTFEASEEISFAECIGRAVTIERGWTGYCGCSCNWGYDCGWKSYLPGSPYWMTCKHPGCGLSRERRKTKPIDVDRRVIS